jgi:hypothetical protein
MTPPPATRAYSPGEKSLAVPRVGCTRQILYNRQGGGAEERLAEKPSAEPSSIRTTLSFGFRFPVGHGRCYNMVIIE